VEEILDRVGFGGVVSGGVVSGGVVFVGVWFMLIMNMRCEGGIERHEWVGLKW